MKLLMQRFIGVWDTVSSIGWLYDLVTLRFTAMNPDIEIGRHAISIDERRASFRQNLWRIDPKHPQDIEQVWSERNRNKLQRT